MSLGGGTHTIMMVKRFFKTLTYWNSSVDQMITQKGLSGTKKVVEVVKIVLDLG